jgi:hypothetical protein
MKCETAVMIFGVQEIGDAGTIVTDLTDAMGDLGLRRRVILLASHKFVVGIISYVAIETGIDQIRNALPVYTDQAGVCGDNDVALCHLGVPIPVLGLIVGCVAIGLVVITVVLLYGSSGLPESRRDVEGAADDHLKGGRSLCVEEAIATSGA